MNDGTLPSSFRDPSGFLFRRGGVLYRQINVKYKDDYDRLIESGLYKTLADGGLLVSHVETDTPGEAPADAYKVIRPEEIPFISYPYEWCFSQLKAAALATLAIQKKAFDHGMSLKDASAYNIQFASGRPVLVDTLSFERYDEGRPWVAYRQFCQHFLAPLALMSRADVRLSQLLKVYIDGVPLDLASKLLPMRTRLSFGLLTHIHLNARFQARYADRQVNAAEITKRKMSRMSFLGLIHSLESTVKGLAYKAAGTEWADYYSDTNYTREALEAKARIVGDFLDAARPQSVWDLGANTGFFSRIAAEKGARVVALDIDPAAVERHYLECRKTGEKNILPLVADLTNPSPAIGWQNRERAALVERGPADVAMALALVHHLAISNNVPFGRLAEFFAEAAGVLIIEFVPKSDSQVQRLLATREDIFRDYNEAQFQRAFERLFVIERKAVMPPSDRSLYLMRKRAGG